MLVHLLTALLVLTLVALTVVGLRSGAGDEALPGTELARGGAGSGALSRVGRTTWGWFLAPLAALVVFGGLSSLGVLTSIATATAAVTGATVWMLTAFLAERRLSLAESQMADAIDLMVSALRAGSGMMEALETSARESRRPLKGVLLEMTERIRIGEEPAGVLASMEGVLPVEGFRLFTFTLGAHWRGGGSLASTLSGVGRSIRDRVDVKRRIQSQAVETQASVVGILGVTYGLAYLMYSSYPDRFTTFSTSSIGSMFIVLSIVLQGVGLLWISRLTRIEV